jgi:hypothetical protein
MEIQTNLQLWKCTMMCSIICLNIKGDKVNAEVGLSMIGKILFDVTFQHHGMLTLTTLEMVKK